MNNDHSTQMLSGGSMSVENVNVVNNKGSFDTDKNASTSSFDPNLLDSFLKYPTVLYDGTISSSMNIGTTIYETNVSPTTMLSTSLTRIANFATNFRQWTGSMAVRLIFTKPIFVQTKVIMAFIPGANVQDSQKITISDLYGAQYHVVMNPDNDNELEFKIPFISGVNWLNMESSTGLLIIKLFQPLIASQPTGVSNVSIPFTITLSSNTSTLANGEKLMPINFRYLVAPTYQNQVLNNDFREVLVNAISPQIKNMPTDKYAGFIPKMQNEGQVAKTLVFLPKSRLPEYIEQNYFRNAENTGFLNTPCSLDTSRDLIFTNSNIPISPPFAHSYLTGVTYKKKVYPYGNINANMPLLKGEYTLDSASEAVRVCINSNQLVAPVGLYSCTNFVFSNSNAQPTTFTLYDVVCTIARCPGSDGGYNYFYQSQRSSQAVSAEQVINFISPVTVEMSPMGSQISDYIKEKASMGDIVKSDRNNLDSTHVVLVSTSNQDEVKYQLQNSNYTNLITASQDQMSASFADRAISTSSLVSDDSGISERIDFVTLLMSIKIGADVIAKASRIVSDVLTYVIPIFTINKAIVSPNQIVTFDLTGPLPTYFELDKESQSTARFYPEVDNPQIEVFTV